MSEKLSNRLGRDGFTLIELVIVIVILGIVASVAIPKFADMSSSAKINTTRSEMATIAKAIIGNPEVVAGGQFVDRGFEGDCGFPPSRWPSCRDRSTRAAEYDRK